MLYAKIVLGLAVEGPFDYIVPKEFSLKVNPGSRVWVDFRSRRKLGYVVALTRKTDIKNVKSISELIDLTPVLDKNMLLLTRELADYYCCSWGEAIETALPDLLRKGKSVTWRNPKVTQAESVGQSLLIHDLDGHRRWAIYINLIKEALSKGRSVIFLSPDIPGVIKTQEKITSEAQCSCAVLYRKKPKELEEWLKIKEQKADVVVGTRSAIFAPLNNLGLIIVDEEEDNVYKQDQVPHYHARSIAFMRAINERARLVLGSRSPSLESFLLARENKIAYTFIPRERNACEIKIVDTKFQGYLDKKKNIFLSRYMQDAITCSLNSQDKILLFLNRKGFATFASCQSCGSALKCPRCNINLVYHFSADILSCHYCNYKTKLPRICPNCNAGYIKFSGMGTEKMESELSRLFPQAKIKRIDKAKDANLQEADMFIATSGVTKETGLSFNLSLILAIDNSLNRLDLRSSEKTFALLVGIMGLTEKKLIIQTGFPQHHIFDALVKNDVNIFYDTELKQRNQLKFPPYRHLALVKLRGRKEEQVNGISNDLCKMLRSSVWKGIRVISVNPAQPAKLRGNFYWQVLVSADSPKRISKFLKNHLKKFSHSDIIVTVDVDPL